MTTVGIVAESAAFAFAAAAVVAAYGTEAADVAAEESEAEASHCVHRHVRSNHWPRLVAS